MSLPFYQITCTGCEFTGGYNFGIDYVYEGPPERRPLVGSAWCANCDHIVNACVPFDQGRADEEILEKESWIAHLKRGLFAMFSKSKQAEIRSTEQEILAIRQRASHFEQGHFKPRCLSCGGSSVFPFGLPYGDYGEVEGLNITHSCGGQLLVSMEGRFSFASRPKVFFDADGNVIRRQK